MRNFFGITMAACLLGLIAVGSLAAEDQVEAEPGSVPDSSRGWIGVMCHPVQGVLASQLQLPEGQGLVVMDVVAESPAAAAGVLRHDVLLSAAGEPLKSVSGLSESIDKHLRKRLSIELLRGGRKQNLTVTPEARPEDQGKPILVPGQDRRALREWLEQLEPEADLGVGQDHRLRLRFFHRGELFGGTFRGKDWPEDLNISVTRKGNEPIKIVVKHGEEQWEISREELGKLPEKIQPFVEGMLGDAAAGAQQDGDIEIDLPEIRLPEFGQPVEPPAVPPAVPQDLPREARNAQRRMQQRLQEIQRQLEQLQQELQDRSEDAADAGSEQESAGEEAAGEEAAGEEAE